MDSVAAYKLELSRMLVRCSGEVIALCADVEVAESIGC
jgi:hypothetical protein